MSEGWILFLSVFLGILVGGIVGTLALKFLGSINNFYKRRELITNIRAELKLNSVRLRDLKECFIEGLELESDIYTYLTSKDIFFSGMKKDFYNRYLNDFILLKDNNIINEIFRIYDFEYIINTFKFYCYGLIYTLKKDKEKIEEATKMGLNSHKLKSSAEKITSETFKNFKNLTKDAAEQNMERIEKIIIDLDKIYRQNIFIFWFGKNV